MKHAGATRVILATALVASSIMAMKTVMPSLPLSGTVIAATIGLVLIFSLYRSDALRRREIALEMTLSAMPSEPMTSDAIRHRMETRPLPQIRPGPLTREASSSQSLAPVQATKSAAGTANYPALELVQCSEDVAKDSQSVLELTDFMALVAEPETTVPRSSTTAV
ncbi:hypothetical protein EKN06_01895 [Croceicoccus ponticola]|uniref:Uncharacterized protein n=1 Tax=Croceicoccus ponticola TaxID=2217664 RepID=A0A437H051_9SPHN|nr:hypothetical protein [Croceicoccus ponticola]RVQ68991.1 hypothetical protein EKN06_01895 [Croceicoccus ponticola]